MDTPKQVRCSVLNCKYNQSRSCHADSVDVNAVSGKAYNSEGTSCATFKEG